MWLFDNLFLDQNTPVMINDGVDHSKDVVTEIVPPAGWGSSGKWDDSTGVANPVKPDPKTESFDTLFESGKAEQINDKKIDKEAPVIEFSSAIAPPDASIPEAGVSFDIGGDMSFDIGGDMSGISTAGDVATAASVDVSSSPVSFITDTISVGTIDTPSIENITPMTDTAVVPDTPLDTAAISSVSSIESISTIPWVTGEADSALFSLLNDDTAVAETPVSDITITSEAVTPASPDNSIFGTTDLGLPQISPLEVVSSSLISPVISALEISTVGSPFIAEISENISTPASSKLKSKLEEFIDELKTLELEDQEVKVKKRQQFDMFRVRAQEIKAEYDMRIHALELEEKALETQITAMDTEKTHIKDVISAFQKQLENA